MVCTIVVTTFLTVRVAHVILEVVHLVNPQHVVIARPRVQQINQNSQEEDLQVLNRNRNLRLGNWYHHPGLIPNHPNHHGVERICTDDIM